MNSFLNFIKLGLARAVCFLTLVFLTACTPPAPIPKSSTSTATTAPPRPAANKQTTAEPDKQASGLASSHGADANNLINNNLSWTLIDGDQKTVENYRGKVVILDFWATYCPPCEEEIPHLVELSNKYKNDLHVVGLHVGGTEDKANIADFIIKYRMSYDLGYPQQELTDFYLKGDTRIPQTLVFDRNGQLVQQFVGFTPQIKADLNEVIEQALSNGNR